MSKDTEDIETTEKETPKASGAVRREGSVSTTKPDEVASADAPGAKDEKSSDDKGADARTPDEIRADIEETRADMGDTVEALAEKSDVKGQAKAKVDEVKERVQQKREEYTAKAKETTPESAQASGQAALTKVQENPTPVIIAVAVIVGFLLGRRR